MAGKSNYEEYGGKSYRWLGIIELSLLGSLWSRAVGWMYGGEDVEVDFAV